MGKECPRCGETISANAVSHKCGWASSYEDLKADKAATKRQDGLGKDTCGCLYLTSGKIVFLVQGCDHEHVEWEFNKGWRVGKEKPTSKLKPVSDEQATRIFTAWGKLISDGYAARDIAFAMKRINSHNRKDI